MSALRRAVAWTAGLLAFSLAYTRAATAEYLGTDVLGNISPTSDLGGIADRYPLSHYQLDYHVSVGVTDLDGVGPSLQQAAAQQVIDLMFNVVKMAIDIFSWAFDLQIITGADGLLPAIDSAMRRIHDNVASPEILACFVIAVGVWVAWKGLIQSRRGEAMMGVMTSIGCAFVCLWLIYNPADTVGAGAKLANQAGASILGSLAPGENDSQGRRVAANHLFQTGIYQPWVVLQFGGLKHCVDTDRTIKDGYPVPVDVGDPAADVCRDHINSVDGYGGYAARFLKHAPSSDERNAEYTALRKGMAPDDAQFRGYRVSKVDSPAVDIQQAGGATQRFTLSVLYIIAFAGFVLLLLRMAIAMLVAQVVALACLAAAPIALPLGLMPWTQRIFKWWLGKLATAVFIKVAFALILLVILAVSLGITELLGSRDYLLVAAFQAGFFWILYAGRKTIMAQAAGAMSGKAGGWGDEAAFAAMHPIRAYSRKSIRRNTSSSSTTRQGGQDGEHGRDGETQRRGTRDDVDRPRDDLGRYTTTTPNGQPVGEPVEQRNGRARIPDSSSPPATAGREHSPALDENGNAVPQEQPPAAAQTQQQRAEATAGAQFAQMSDDELVRTMERIRDQGAPKHEVEQVHDAAKARGWRSSGHRADPAPPPRSPGQEHQEAMQRLQALRQPPHRPQQPLPPKEDSNA